MITRSQIQQRSVKHNVLRWDSNATRVDDSDRREYIRGMAAEPESVREYRLAERDNSYNVENDGGYSE